MPKQKIYKVQLPLASNEPVPCAMIYTKGRQNQQLIPESQVKDFMKGEKKKFVWGSWDSVLDQFNYHKDAPFQDW